MAAEISTAFRELKPISATGCATSTAPGAIPSFSATWETSHSRGFSGVCTVSPCGQYGQRALLQLSPTLGTRDLAAGRARQPPRWKQPYISDVRFDLRHDEPPYLQGKLLTGGRIAAVELSQD